MPTFKLVLLANNDAGSWQSWPDKIAQIKSFYAPVCNLDITLIKTTLTPQFTVFEGGVYSIDEDWYQANVVRLKVPPTLSTLALACIKRIPNASTAKITA